MEARAIKRRERGALRKIKIRNCKGKKRNPI
jgi:hypothetical protein